MMKNKKLPNEEGLPLTIIIATAVITIYLMSAIKTIF